jgi:hypothetical protein
MPTLDVTTARIAWERMEPQAGERLLASGQAEGGEWVLATTRRLGVIAPEGTGIVGAWSEVAHVTLTGKPAALTVTWVNRDHPTTAVLGRGRRRLTSAIHERVTASVVATRHVPVPGGTVQVALRRMPDGGLFCQVIAPGGVDLTDARATRAVEAVRTGLCDAVGLDPREAPQTVPQTGEARLV